MGEGGSSGAGRAGASFCRVYEVMRALRGPGGCPWDREQTPSSVRANLVEEAYECIEAITSRKPGHIREELGDVFLVATFMAYMYEEEGAFSVADVLEGLADKLVRRHPHVFGDSSADTADKVLAQWKEIKVKVEGKKPKDSVIDEVPGALPPLERAYKIQKKAAKAGFDWSAAEDVWDKVREETEEAHCACASANADKLEEEIGDLFFSIVNLSRFLKIDPSLALARASAKFTRRFQEVERRMKEEGLPLSRENFALMDRLWDEVKGEE
ncbi:MAG: nucleoside triphosphate pyrophosphohydrolase [Spirochaetales bacterium]|jgi:tetrapyrrole methylase family protein/MazG family protein|nr:nucleoside triphosphate pyrophosphohydrolase [Spirochaetales bacterium]